MKKIERWVCEICGTEYDNENAAIECENHHCTPKEIVSGRYLAYADNRLGYPLFIDVKMDDGNIVSFKRIPRGNG